MKTFICLIAAILLLGCAAQHTASPKQPHNRNADTRYGYSKSDPVKVGGVSDGPRREREYLHSLSGPNGEKVWFNRDGSCCPFDTPNSEFGGMLDIYSVTYEGKGDTVKIYINMYD